MASLLAIAGTAVINAVAFSGSNYVFHKLSRSDEEQKRFNDAKLSMERDHLKWIEKRQNDEDKERKRRQAADTAEKNMQELDESMLEYTRAWEARNPEPQLHMYYHPSAEQKNKDYLTALATIAGTAAVAYYVL